MVTTLHLTKGGFLMWRTLASALVLSWALCPVVAPVLAQTVPDTAQVRQLTIRTDTANESNAKTASDVFFCYGGRELNLDTANNDRENNQVDVYQFGTADSNVVNAKENNPTVGPTITMGMVHAAPVYLRMQDGDTDHWVVTRVEAELKDAQGGLLTRYCFIGRAILGPSTGMTVPLWETRDRRPCS
jgi:hypothetical protein